MQSVVRGDARSVSTGRSQNRSQPSSCVRYGPRMCAVQYSSHKIESIRVLETSQC